MKNKEGKMSYVILEPLGIKMRRCIEWITNTEDPKVKQFDENHKKMFDISHGIIGETEHDEKASMP